MVVVVDLLEVITVIEEIASFEVLEDTVDQFSHPLLLTTIGDDVGPKVNTSVVCVVLLELLSDDVEPPMTEEAPDVDETVRVDASVVLLDFVVVDLEVLDVADVSDSVVVLVGLVVTSLVGCTLVLSTFVVEEVPTVAVVVRVLVDCVALEEVEDSVIAVLDDPIEVVLVDFVVRDVLEDVDETEY